MQSTIQACDILALLISEEGNYFLTLSWYRFLLVHALDFNCVHVYRSEPPNLTDKKYFDVATNPGEQTRFAFLSV